MRLTSHFTLVKKSGHMDTNSWNYYRKRVGGGKKRPFFPTWCRSNLWISRRALIFCAKINSNCSTWLKCYWNRVDWIQEMVFNTYHCINTCLDTKNQDRWKKFQNYCFLQFPISLIYLNGSLRSCFWVKNYSFVFIEKCFLYPMSHNIWISYTGDQ